MKKDIIKYILSSLAALIIIGSIIYLISNVIVENKGKEEPAQQTTVDLVLPIERTDGMLTILKSDGTVYYQYSGEIDIRNNGRNGEPIEVVIELPYSGN